MTSNKNKRESKPKNIIANKVSPVKSKSKQSLITPIMRLKEFVKWAKDEGLCKSEFDFERQCRLSPKYINNNSCSGKGNMGTEMLGRIVSVFPQLNLAWLCTGKESMLRDKGEFVNIDYKEAHEAALAQIEILNRMLNNFISKM